jgi:hypothetical protein
MKSRVWFGIGIAALLGVAFAQSIKQISVSLAGKIVTLESVVVKGKTFVSLEQLRKAFPTAAGGASQVAAKTGCIGELLFNGAWRFRVNSLVYSLEDKAWYLNLELRNGMNQVASVYGNGANGLGEDISLILENGDSLNLGTSASNQIQDDLLLKKLAPGATATSKVFFAADADSPKATKFLWAMSAANNYDKAPLSKDPAFRVDLTCKK